MTRPPQLRSLLREFAAHERHDPRDERLRLAVQLRARNVCEYCLLPTGGQFHVDHIIPPTRWSDYTAGRLVQLRPTPLRRGPDHLDNFAWCCPFCNVAKRDAVAARVGRRAYRLFDPRRDRWPDHFVFAHNYLFVVGLPGIGLATERTLRFNDPRLGGPLGARHDAIFVGQYPPPWARAWSGSAQP